ncbi:hypothetical protein DM860_015028 [Cuscuta australis]|uniref:Uncharacterized protein n=1 Tax=Cuscuta australis TaxID=267555 RepID=A0A328DEE0_9ASTE|nr:hypothetical protein DM860_015028 [Cuscuta australis]
MQTIEEGRRRRGDDKGRRGEEAKTMENGVTREGDGGGGFIVETLEYPLPIVNPARHILLFCKLERATEETGAALFFFPGPAIAAATASRNRHSVNRRLATWRQLLFKPAANFLSSSGVTGDPSGNQYRRRPPWSETQQRKSDNSGDLRVAPAMYPAKLLVWRAKSEDEEGRSWPAKFLSGYV